MLNTDCNEEWEYYGTDHADSSEDQYDYRKRP
jgi:hypothetical protein